jgi:hypothetical protein
MMEEGILVRLSCGYSDSNFQAKFSESYRSLLSYCPCAMNSCSNFFRNYKWLRSSSVKA